jgi:hypothetical protein
MKIFLIPFDKGKLLRLTSAKQCLKASFYKRCSSQSAYYFGKSRLRAALA